MLSGRWRARAFAPGTRFERTSQGRPSAYATCRNAARVLRGSTNGGFTCRSGTLVATWKRLSRPLHIPSLPAGAACPISAVASRIDFRAHNVGTGIGPGPVFPAPFSPDAPEPLNDFSAPADWHGGKHAFFMLSAYHGRALIRGGQLDGPGTVTFASNEIRGAPALSDPKPELRLDVGTPQVVHTFFFLKPPGCYAYQIDGTTFSYVVVFHVGLSA